MAITIVCYSYLPAVYQFLNPITFLSQDSIQMVGIALLLISFLWTLIAQVQMSDSWRIGIDYDVNRRIYEEIKNITLDDLKAFFDAHVKGKSYHICVIGKKENIDLDVLRSMGEFQELSLEEIFGY